MTLPAEPLPVTETDVTVVDRPPEPAEGSLERSPSSREPARAAVVHRPPAAPWRALVLRLHFYAGVFVAPFLALAALTGLAFVFTPQLDSILYGHELHVRAAGRTALPLAQQVAAARRAHPEGSVTEIDPPGGPGDTTRVVLSLPQLGEDQRTVFVDPYTGAVRGVLTTWSGETPLTTWLDAFHRNLHLGDVGRNYSEVAASWLWVLVLGGLVLWWQRVRRAGTQVRGLLRRLAVPDLRPRKGVRRTRGWHAAVGVWVSVGLLFLSATGLTWSRWAGAHFDQALTSLSAHTPDFSATLPAGAVGASSPGASGSAASVDAVLAAARAEGLTQGVEIVPPGGPGKGWTVSEFDRSWPIHMDRALVDPQTGRVVSVSRFADWPLLAQLTRYGIDAHMGYLFGLLNQILLAALALGLLCVIVWGYRMWWQRRPTGTRLAVGPPPPRGTWRTVPRAPLMIAVAVAASIGWALPVLGLTLLAFLCVDGALAGIRRIRRPAAADPV